MEYQRKIGLDSEDEIWQAEIVMSSSPRLPSSMKGDDVITVCTVEATFPKRILRQVRGGQKIEGYQLIKPWWKKDSGYILVEFELCVIVGSADVRFQLKTRDGRTFSDDHVDIEIAWEQGPRPAIGHGKSAHIYRKRRRRQ